MAKASFLDPVVVAQLGNLHLRARHILDGLTSGRHRFLSRGSSQEFSEHRAYNPGDDLKALDWKILGRTDRLVVKQYENETNMMGVIVVDDSASMGFKSGKNISKLEYAKTMAAALAYLLVAQGDGAGFFIDSKASFGASREFLEKSYSDLEKVEPHGVFQFTTQIKKLSESFRRRALVIVLSDLMGDFDHIFHSLRSLASLKNDVMVFQILDPFEVDLDSSGPILFEDLESGKTLRADIETIRENYKKKVAEKLSMAENIFGKAGIEYLSLTTNTSFERGLGAYLFKRGLQF